MKKKKLKLSLNKMTVAKITDSSNIKGGDVYPVLTRDGNTCDFYCDDETHHCVTFGPENCETDPCYTNGCNLLTLINKQGVCVK